VYVNGISTSLPRDAQERIVHSIRGLERASILQYGYAVEYTYVPPTQLRATLETKAVPGLYCAGQINGTSGYEEAAGQGLAAGVNAVLKLRGEGEFVLGRDEAYIGVLIDDLVTKGVTEPYRMFTSRAEHRLILRQDNADLRLTERGRRLGIVDDRRYERFLRYKESLEKELRRLDETRIRPSEMPQEFLEKIGMTPPDRGFSLAELLSRPEVSYEQLAMLGETPADPRVCEQAAIQIKYAGYIERQQELIERQRRWEERRLPEDFDFASIRALSNEAKTRLTEVRPRTLGQASRVSGVAPSDIEVLMIHLRAGEGIGGSPKPAR
jgi:tRNA uridine 5-carboxymethylaminomethyl modification enzyme